MVLAICFLVFLTALLWGSLAGAGINRTNPSVKVHIPRNSALTMSFIFTVITIGTIATTSASRLAVVMWIIVLLTGLILGFFVGRKVYTFL